MYTEQNIRGLAINFLRQHYKLRPRLGTSGTRVITKVHYYKGTTIDARLSYQQPDGKWFMATVEATSADRAHEVIYRVNWFRITVHALALALLAMLLVLGVAQVLDTSIFEWFGRPGTYLFLLTGFATLWTAIGAALSGLKYYRYIYAIAQFMRFHADAQWIAYDRTIFFAPLSDETSDRAARRYERRMRRYFVELQRQCIRFGFGLMEVRENNEVRWLIEPSHIDQFDGERGKLPQWISAIQAPPMVAKLGKALPLGKTSAPAPAPPKTDIEDDVADPLAVGSYLPRQVREVDYQESITPLASKRLAWYRQPLRLSKSLRWKVRRAFQALYPPEIKNRPGYYEIPLWLVSLFFLGLLGFSYLVYQQSHWGPDAKNGQKEAAFPLSPLEPVADASLSDARPGLLPGEYDQELTAREFADANNGMGLPPEVVNSEVGARKNVSVLEISAAHQAVASYDCLPLFLAQGTLYLLVEGRYVNYPAAVARAEFINDRYEIAVGVAAGSCLDPLATNFLVYLGGVQATQASANLNMRRLQGDLKMDLEAIEIK